MMVRIDEGAAEAAEAAGTTVDSMDGCSRDNKASAKRVTDTDHSCGVSRWVID